ncbi:hypothetical protein QBC35DRAFT_60913 [Podospora australis]|uniref:Uncharacterized protein n=1 Tax=Podospora australis TaxID=1536484 RepID=A0AAN7AEI5_9PEZI|nr:hypothetical protein QBC35DRAFT_60913 [Podospora australis]
MLRNILALTLLATGAVVQASPVPDAAPALLPRAVCVLAEGENGYTIDPFTRPPCVCKCLKSSCEEVTNNDEDYLLCVKTPWPSDANPWSSQLIVAFGRCTGAIRCIG